MWWSPVTGVTKASPARRTRRHQRHTALSFPWRWLNYSIYVSTIRGSLKAMIWTNASYLVGFIKLIPTAQCSSETLTLVGHVKTIFTVYQHIQRPWSGTTEGNKKSRIKWFKSISSKKICFGAVLTTLCHSLFFHFPTIIFPSFFNADLCPVSVKTIKLQSLSSSSVFLPLCT